MDLPLNALRAFEAAARHLSFTRAADELHLTPAAVSQHIKNLEQRFSVKLFRRLPRGLALTDEGLALLPTLAEAFERLSNALNTLRDARAGRPREPLSVGVVATFAVGWLMPRIGPRGLEFARARVEMKAVETVLHLRRAFPARIKNMVPDHVWRLVKPYGLEPGADEVSGGPRAGKD
jgi:LysR family transcriptional regulator of beta-lactamase